MAELVTLAFGPQFVVEEYPLYPTEQASAAEAAETLKPHSLRVRELVATRVHVTGFAKAYSSARY